MVAQVNYQKGLSKGLPGQLYDVGNTNIDSFAAEAIVPFGRFVARGTDPENQVLVSGAATSIGVSVRVAKENTLAGSTFTGGQYEITETVGVLRSGDMYAEFDAAGGVVGAVVTINASGQVVAAGGGTALTEISATIESVATDVTQDVTSIFVGRIKVNG